MAYFKPKQIAEDEKQEKQQDYDNVNDYTGYKSDDLFIPSAKYQNLKEEVINSDYYIWTEFKEKVIKATEYMQTNAIKKIKAKLSGWSQAYHYGIKEGQEISLQHLKSVILYTDFSDLCSSFSSTFRPIYFGEPLQEIKKRNRNYFHLSKLLRETVECFGYDY